MLSISGLTVKEENYPLLEDISLEVAPDEVHAIIGNYESGKSVIGEVLTRRPGLEIVSGKINFKRKSIKNLSSEDCSRLGIFLSFQDPPMVVGISNLEFIEKTLSVRGLDIAQVKTNYKNLIREFQLGSEWGKKVLNSSSSILEKKKNEIAHMLFLDPSLIVLDSFEDGLDDDALDEMSKIIKEFLSIKGKSAIIISKETRLLDRIKPDRVHLMKDGKIIKSGDKRIIKRIITNGD
jgi:Fe-S cluster assembly ATP-binding protein